MSRTIKTSMINTDSRTRRSHRIAAMTTLLSLLIGSTAIISNFQSASAQNLTFSSLKRIPGTTSDAEPPQIVPQGKNLYVIWHEFPVGDNQPDVFLSRSTNSGNTFSNPATNLSNTTGVDSSQETIFVSGKNVFVVWTENASEIWFRRSTDGGASFAPAKKIAIAGNPNNPRVTAFDKNVFVAWQADGVNGNPDIFIRQSSDTGINFAMEKNISNNVGSSEFRDHGLRQIIVSDKKVIVVWRDDTLGVTTGYEIFYAQGK